MIIYYSIGCLLVVISVYGKLSYILHKIGSCCSAASPDRDVLERGAGGGN